MIKGNKPFGTFEGINNFRNLYPYSWYSYICYSLFILSYLILLVNIIWLVVLYEYGIIPYYIIY